ncbi:hypothetical protein DFH06DRAFT_1229193 [Mycena polygramma]|nr:hypothetical protein DFH06DRAFT_1229193 [Mycena polygramma]
MSNNPLLDLEYLRIAKNRKTILLAENTESGELGFEPFIITEVRKTAERILLDIYHPKFMPREVDERHKAADAAERHAAMLLGISLPPLPEEKDDNVTWDISIHMGQLELDSERKLKSKAKRLVKGVDYNLLRGKLVDASATMLRSRFVCPECSDTRSVCPGCGGFSMRFPDLFTSCGWSMPCPTCIGYGMASYAKGIQDDKTKLKKLWKKINEMLDKDIQDLSVKRKGISVEDTQNMVTEHHKDKGLVADAEESLSEWTLL